VNKSRH